MEPPSEAYRPLFDLIDGYTTQLGDELKQRLVKGQVEYNDSWVDLTPEQVIAMLHEEELDLIVYRLMLFLKLSHHSN